MSPTPVQLLFLGIDGVLVSEASTRFWKRSPVPGVHAASAWCPTASSNFQTLLEETPASMKIVVQPSSSDSYTTLAELQSAFTARGIDASRIVGLTPVVPNGSVDDRIAQWVLNNSTLFISDWAILDDAWVGRTNIERLVKVDPFVGLTLRQVYTIVNRFKPEA